MLEAVSTGMRREIAEANQAVDWHRPGSPGQDRIAEANLGLGGVA
jgi:hypothetical protein